MSYFNQINILADNNSFVSLNRYENSRAVAESSQLFKKLNGSDTNASLNKPIIVKRHRLKSESPRSSTRIFKMKLKNTTKPRLAGNFSWNSRLSAGVSTSTLTDSRHYRNERLCNTSGQLKTEIVETNLNLGQLVGERSTEREIPQPASPVSCNRMHVASSMNSDNIGTKKPPSFFTFSEMHLSLSDQNKLCFSGN